MEIGKNIVVIGVASVVCALDPVVLAGEFSDAENGKVYEFTRCVEPSLPDLSVDPTLKGRRAQRAINQSISRYNDHVEQANVFLQCISGEAGDDLDQYYQAVTASFNASQNKAIGNIEAMRIELGLDEDLDQIDAIAEDVNDQLLGQGIEVPQPQTSESPAIEAVADNITRGTESLEGQILPDLVMEPIGK